jgi:hypothetical protein
MAEGMLGGILGEDDEKPEVEAAETLASADAFAAAVAAKLAGNDPGVARKTEIFLDKQAQILETQNQHLKEEHAARLRFLQGQAREVDLRRFGLRLRVGFQLFLVTDRYHHWNRADHDGSRCRHLTQRGDKFLRCSAGACGERPERQSCGRGST